MMMRWWWLLCCCNHRHLSGFVIDDNWCALTGTFLTFFHFDIDKTLFSITRRLNHSLVSSKVIVSTHFLGHLLWLMDNWVRYFGDDKINFVSFKSHFKEFFSRRDFDDRFLSDSEETTGWLTGLRMIKEWPKLSMLTLWLPLVFALQVIRQLNLIEITSHSNRSTSFSKFSWKYRWVKCGRSLTALITRRPLRLFAFFFLINYAFDINIFDDAFELSRLSFIIHLSFNLLRGHQMLQCGAADYPTQHMCCLRSFVCLTDRTHSPSACNRQALIF